MIRILLRTSIKYRTLEIFNVARSTAGFGVSLTEEEAANIRDRYFREYRVLRRWHRQQGKKTATRTLLDRRRTFEGKTPYTQLLNSPIQGTGADGLKLAMAKLWESRGSLGPFPVLVAHDEIVIEVPADRADEAKEWVVKCMVEGMGEYVQGVPIVVEAEIKESWG